MSDIHALSGAYAIDALDDLERAEFERHLAECAECRAEVDSLREAAAVLGESAATPPPDELRARVLAGIATVRPLPPVVDPAATRPAESTSRWRRWRPAALVAAAAVIAAVGAGVVVTEPWDDPTSQPQLSAVDRVLAADDAEAYTRTFADGSSATLTRSKSLNRAVLTTQDMAPPPPGKVYELWLDHEGIGMVPAGLMPPQADATILLEGDPGTARGAGITIEPAGGSKKPTGETVALIPFEKT